MRNRLHFGNVVDDDCVLAALIVCRLQANVVYQYTIIIQLTYEYLVPSVSTFYSHRLIYF